MKNLIYLVLIALIVHILADILYRLFKTTLERIFKKLIEWMERVFGPRMGHFLKSLSHSVRHGRIGAILWFLGFLTVLYILAFGVSLYLLDGVPMVDVPRHDVHVPHGQQGEGRILVEDKSFRGLLFKNVFPPASIMQLRITPKQGDVTVLKDGSFGPIGSTTLKVRQGELVMVGYSFAEGYEVGYVQVSVFGLLDDPRKDVAAQVKTMCFVRTAK